MSDFSRRRSTRGRSSIMERTINQGNGVEFREQGPFIGLDDSQHKDLDFVSQDSFAIRGFQSNLAQFPSQDDREYGREYGDASPPVTPNRCQIQFLDSQKIAMDFEPAAKRPRTDWQNVSQTDENVKNSVLQENGKKTKGVNNIWLLAPEQRRAQWNSFESSALPKFGKDGIMDTMFQTLSCIASGRNCMVMKVRGLLDGLEYAVKEYRPDRTYMTQFVREVQAMSLMEHRNIVRFKFAWIEKDVSVYKGYLQFELCYSNLDQVLKQEGSLKTEEVENLMKQMAMALDCIHKLGIAHMDIKPDNIFIRNTNRSDNENHDREFVLGDFGQVSPVNGCGLPIENGDSRYISAEVLNRSHDRLDLGDMFSLGMTLFHCATGVAPPQNGRDYQKIRESRSFVKSKLPGSMGSKVQQMICALVDPDRERRPTATELLASYNEKRTLPFKARK
eukprot:TRINITY_DN17088_c1_g1_i1.p1 TRINITY_DN17088_c1_g1~~TRINITY_DN17088_c1_g1_i1.p1  ORF type:complete len:475 (-),score=45.05 TRINITY_DN17088_c1_g1_i1:1853-3193(-)